MSERFFRWTAIAIAALALLDPALTLDGRTRPRISVVVQRGPSMNLPGDRSTETGRASAGQSYVSRAAQAEDVRRRLGRDLGNDFDFIDGLDTTAASIVVLGDRYPEEPVPEDARVSTVTLKAAIAPNVAIASIGAPRAVSPATAIRLGIRVDASGVGGATSVLVIRAGGAEAGRASHVWSADRETWRADVDVVPIGAPPFTFDVSIDALPSERTAADNRAVVRVAQAPRLRVLVFEARPSWASAFVRRALESDPRFEVSGVEQAAPRALVRTGQSPSLPTESGEPGGLDGFDAIVVGGLDSVSPAHLAMLDRFVRERGGAVALVPDARIPASVANALVPGITLRETLLEHAAPLETGALPRMDASELLDADMLPSAANVLARASSSHRPVVWSMPRGDGHVLVSGGMDAWRYRAESQVAFDRFWRSVISGLALTARPAVDVTLSPSRARGGERVRVTARIRSLERNRLGDRLAIAARVGDSPLRLWPDAQAGVFAGSFIADESDAAIAAVVSDRTAQTSDFQLHTSERLTIDAHARESMGPPLALLAETRGGVNVTPSDLTKLERHVRDTIPIQSSRAARHPMRSVWWFVVFAVCLSAEWWLRRRRGAR